MNNLENTKPQPRTERFGLGLSKLGRRFQPAYIDAIRLRRRLEALVGQQQGGLSLMVVAKVQTACRLEQSVRCAELLIRDTPGMTPDELRSSRAMIVQWTRERDNLLAKLLDGKAGPGADPWAVLDDDAPPAVQAPEPASGEASGPSPDV